VSPLSVKELVLNLEVFNVECLHSVKTGNVLQYLKISVKASFRQDQEWLLINTRFANSKLTLRNEHELCENLACLKNNLSRLESPCKQIYYNFVDKSLLELSEKEAELLNKTAKDLVNNLRLYLACKLLENFELLDYHVVVK
jgi:hypothetical protein